ncbi:MAG: hypothetical protein IPL78_26820, partial [Chloroflexi bacterium]|nr:hypothetical protein [Chloroflexota bacterium]
MPSPGDEPSSSLQTAFRQIVRDIVEILDYTGAMIATYEPDHSCRCGRLCQPGGGFYGPNPGMELVVSQLMQRSVSIMEPDPDFARVLVNANEHRAN